MADAEHIAWSELDEDRPLPLVHRRHVAGEHAMLSRILLEEGCEVPSHAHANEQFACVLSGRVRFVVGADEREVVVGPDEVLHLPPHVPHAAYALEDSVVLDVFSPPSAVTGVDAAD